MQIVRALFLFLWNNPGVRAALSGLASAALLGAIAWVQSAEAKLMLGGSAWIVQLFAPSIADWSKKEDPAQLTQKQPEKR